MRDDLTRAIQRLPIDVVVTRWHDGHAHVEQVNDHLVTSLGRLGFAPITEGQPVDDLIERGVHPEDRSMVRAEVNDLFSEKGVGSFIFRGPDDVAGAPLWFSCHSQAIDQADGSKVAYTIFFNCTDDDIARHATSDVTRRGTERRVLGKLVAYGFDNASYLDLTTNRLYLVQVRDESVALPPAESDYDETNERSIPIFILEEDQDYCRREFQLARILERLEHEPVVSLFYRLKDRDHTLPGSPHRYMRMSVFYLTKARDALVFCRSDITQIREREREQREKLERALDAAEEARVAEQAFLANMSHDMRTPLNGILGFADLALSERDPTRRDDYLRKIRASGNLMLDLVNDVLDMSKIASGKMELHQQVFDVQELSRNIVDTIGVAATEKGIDLVVDISDSGARYICADRLRLHQLILNLLTNAVKFTPAGGTVTYRVSTVAGPGDVNRRIEVIDTGIGIDSEFLPRIFESFAQERRDGIPVQRGTGLGLSIVKSIVGLMGGTIEVQSEVGKGTAFTVLLPIQEATEHEAPATRQRRTASIAGMRVLLCEDNDLNAEICETVLRERAGAHVVRAHDGTEGVERFESSEEGAFDLILMDVRMPVMNGIDATRRIRALEREDARTIPIVALTADAYAEDIRRCTEAGMDDHLSKPVDPKTLIETLATWSQAHDTDSDGRHHG